MAGIFNLITAVVPPQVKEDAENLDDPPELVQETPSLSTEGRSQFDTNIELGKNSNASYWIDFINETDLEAFKQEAYVNHDGLAIRKNPVTGYNELFVAGSRTRSEWAQNFLEGGSKMLTDVDMLLKVKGGYDKVKLVKNMKGLQKLEALDPSGTIILHGTHNVLDSSEVIRDQFAEYIDQVIKEYEIDVVYAHSRGAATVSNLHSDVKIIGLDGAMYLAHSETNFLNLSQVEYEGFGIDEVLQAGYSNTLSLEGRAFHDVARAKNEPKRANITESEEARLRAEKRAKHETRVHKSRKRIQVFDKILGRMSKKDQEKAVFDYWEKKKLLELKRQKEEKKRNKKEQLEKRRRYWSERYWDAL